MPEICLWLRPLCLKSDNATHSDLDSEFSEEGSVTETGLCEM